jgi:hypothetical protein
MTTDKSPVLSVGFQPSICPRCAFIKLETDIGATLCPYHADAVVMDAIGQ